LIVCYVARGKLLPAVGRALDVRPQVQSADVIVVLGGGNGDRERYASDLFRQGLARHVIATGSPVGSDVGANLLADQGVPRDAIVLANGTLNTREDALGSLELMRQHNWRTALLVTDTYHERRSLWTFRTAFASTGLEVWPAPVVGGWFDANHWWRTEDGFVAVNEEYLKLAYYLARGYIQLAAITAR